METGTILVISLVAGLILFVFLYPSGSKKEKFKNPVVDSMLSLDLHEYVASANFKSALGVSKDMKNVYFANSDSPTKKYEICDLVAIEMTESGKSIQKITTSSSLGKAVLGAAAFGPMGAVLGAGSKTKVVNKDAVNSVAVLITFNDPETPLNVIEFLSGPVPRGSAEHNGAKRTALEWIAKLKVLIERAGDQCVPTSEDSTGKLLQLAQLVDKGMLTKEEFESEKSKLLKP